MKLADKIKALSSRLSVVHPTEDEWMKGHANGMKAAYSEFASIAATHDALMQQMAEALEALDESYCRAGPGLTREERNEDRMQLIAARAALRAYKEQQ